MDDDGQRIQVEVIYEENYEIYRPKDMKEAKEWREQARKASGVPVRIRLRANKENAE